MKESKLERSIMFILMLVIALMLTFLVVLTG